MYFLKQPLTKANFVSISLKTYRFQKTCLQNQPISLSLSLSLNCFHFIPYLARKFHVQALYLEWKWKRERERERGVGGWGREFFVICTKKKRLALCSKKESKQFKSSNY